jgi:acyl-coenzyme A thioesterase PaaI-like protein
MNEDERTRTFSWQYPLIAAEASRRMSGMDYLLSVIRGELPMPPIMATLGLDQIPAQCEPGKITFFLDAKEYHYSGIGSVHCGVISTLLDFARDARCSRCFLQGSATQRSN